MKSHFHCELYPWQTQAEKLTLCAVTSHIHKGSTDMAVHLSVHRTILGGRKSLSTHQRSVLTANYKEDNV